MMPKIKEEFEVDFDGGIILVSSSFEAVQNISVVTAIYGSDKCMVKAEVHDAVLEKGEIIEIAAPNADGSTIKCFILYKNSLEPLKEAAIFKINNGKEQFYYRDALAAFRYLLYIRQENA